jgi:hypothetical protein
MSEGHNARIIKRVPPRDEAQVSVRERVAHGIDCAHCTRDSLTIVNGVLTWKAAHDDVHANSITMSALFKIYAARANAATLKDLRRMIDERLEAA